MTSETTVTPRYRLAAVAAVVMGVTLVSCSPNTSGEPSGSAETTQTTSSPASSAVASVLPLPDGPLLPGTYSISPQDVDALRVVITLPSGWYGGGFGVSKDDSIDPPDGAGIMFWGGRYNVYDDPCGWSTALPDSRTGSTVDDLVTALSAQPTRDATVATDVQVGGFSGKGLELVVPIGLVFDTLDGFADCDEGEFRSWISADGNSFRVHQGPGQRDRLWIVDVEGTRVIIDATFYEGTTATAMAEIDTILESIRFK